LLCKEFLVIEPVFATADFPAETPAGRAQVWKGSHWPADDPIVKAYPDRFSPDPRFGLQYTREPEGWDAPPVEQATAAPGEKRTTRRQS
jgi:hypothetical protein